MRGGIARHAWTVEHPAGSISTFVPSACAADPALEASVDDIYRFQLSMFDDAGVEASELAQTTVTVVPAAAIGPLGFEEADLRLANHDMWEAAEIPWPGGRREDISSTTTTNIRRSSIRKPTPQGRPALHFSRNVCS